MTTRIIIARHGNNFTKEQTPLRVGARTDLPLVETERVTNIGKYLKMRTLIPAVVFAAPLKRTTETARLAIAALDKDIPLVTDSRYTEILSQNPRDWLLQVQYAISQSLIRQFTNSVGTYSSAIADNAANPFLYFNRAVTRAEMIDFISGLDNPYQRISSDSDPANKLTNHHTRTNNYDEAIAHLATRLRLFPNFAEAYYNRGTLLALSGKLPEAFEDFSRAIELNPLFAEAFYNRGMTQIYMKDTRKGCLDLSKAGELGITSAYEILKRYTGEHTEAF